MSATVLAIMCVVIVLALAAWLVAVALANRTSPSRNSHVEPRRGRVQGGTHLGGGRSVAPSRDGEVTPEDDLNRPTVPVRKPKGTSPMDL